jgi:signal transduction histidine kinase
MSAVASREAEVARLNEELKSFIRSIAHDLAGPLRAIDGFTEALADEYATALDTTGMEYVNELRAAGKHMHLMLNGLIRLARIGQVGISRIEIDVAVVSRAIFERLRASDPDRDVALVVGTSLHANADAELIEEALTELLENAWRFTSARPGATIEVGRAGDGSFYVRDDGVGFDASQKERLFGPFHVLHSASDGGGLGIGLAVVGQIVRRHGGEVWADGERDRGAMFSFTLPTPPHGDGPRLVGS